MPQEHQAHHDTENILHQIQQAYEGKETVSVDTILYYVGRRSFGPIILCIGAFLVVPGLSDISTVPTIFGILIVIIGGQILYGRNHIWLPSWLLQRSVKTKRLDAVVRRLQKPTEYIDIVIRPRLRTFATGAGSTIVAAACVGIALLTPLMEAVPFSANLAGVAFVFFGLGLVANDGLMNLFGFAFCAALIGIGVWFFFFS